MRTSPVINQLTQMLASMSAAIYLLIITAIASALGTFIPQGQLASFYLEHYGAFWGHFIVFLSLDRLYHAWWFILIISLLSLSIVLCACQRLRRAKKPIILASLVMHLSVLLIVAGAIWSLGYLHKITIEIPAGQSIALDEYGFAAGQLTLHNFTIEYYPDFQPRQYYSDLTLSAYKGQDYQQQIFVNSPLKAGSLRVYQSSWGPMIELEQHETGAVLPLAIKDQDSLSIDPEQGVELKAIFVPDLDEKSSAIKTLGPLPENPHVWLVLLQNKQPVDMRLSGLNQPIKLGDYEFSFSGFSYYSGLTIKDDPGVYLVFAGFLLMLPAMLFRYVPVFLKRKAQ